MTIGHRSPPRILLLPPGEMKIVGYTDGEGSFARNTSGVFMHTGGWAFVHE